MAALLDLIHKVRRSLHDFPDRAFVGTDTDVTDPLELVLSAGDHEKFKTAGVRLEFDDGTDEMVLTTGAADASSESVPCRRGIDGTTKVNHVAGTAALLDPRFSNAQIAEALALVIDTELWPYVWVTRETTITPDFATGTYDAPAGIEEWVYGYQLYTGEVYPVHGRLLGPVTADDVNFPNGAFEIDPGQFIDTSLVYLSYRQRATLANMTAGSSIEHLAILGASSHLLLMEESVHLAPSGSSVDRGVQEGAKLRAGLVQWQRFEQARQREMTSLTHEEQARRRTYLRGA